MKPTVVAFSLQFQHNIFITRYLNFLNNLSMQEKYEKAMASVAQMEKRVVMAESMLEATLQYESGQVKALSSPRCVRVLSYSLNFTSSLFLMNGPCASKVGVEHGNFPFLTSGELCEH